MAKVACQAEELYGISRIVSSKSLSALFAVSLG